MKHITQRTILVEVFKGDDKVDVETFTTVKAARHFSREYIRLHELSGHYTITVTDTTHMDVLERVEHNL